jgi:hypothetical protein
MLIVKLVNSDCILCLAFKDGSYISMQFGANKRAFYTPDPLTHHATRTLLVRGRSRMRRGFIVF